MYNDLFQIGPITVHSYGALIGIGILAAFMTAMYRARRLGLDADFVFDVGFYSGIIGIISTRLMYYIVELPQIIKEPSMLWDFGYGYVVYGGIIGGVLTGLIYCKKKRKSFMDYFDLVMPSIALAQAFGRLGCFMAGCCYGRRTDSFIGIAFQHSEMAPNGVKLIPTQLISSAGDLLNYLILIWFAKRSKKSGQVGAMYLILYSIGRFFVETLRDDYRGSIGIFSTSQLISMGTIVIGIILFNIGKSKNGVKITKAEDEMGDDYDDMPEYEDDEDEEVVILHQDDEE